jgi:thioesterase domain-containing protein
VEDLDLGLPADRLRGLPLAGLAPAEQLREASRVLAAEIDLAQLLPNFEIFRDLIAAGNCYAPRPVAADLTVVRVERDVVDEFAAHPHRHNADWGWRGLTRGQVRCVRVPGTHHSFLGEPLVDGWCSLLCETEPAAVGRT